MTKKPETVKRKYLYYHSDGFYYKIKTKEVPFTGISEEFYRRSFFEIILRKKPKLRIQKHWKNGKLHGPFEEFYENGQLECKGNWKDGYKHDGLWEYYHEDGQLWARENYKNGKREGLVESFYDADLERDEIPF